MTIGKNMEDFFIEPEKIIRNISVELLVPHPQQAEIYGEDVIEDEFVASIKDKGILTPLTVTPIENGFYQIISGHRRKKGAILAGLCEVPCIIKKYENEAEMKLEFLICNLQREKSNDTKINELYQYKQILCQIGKTRQGKGIYAETIFENEEYWRFAKTSGIFEKVKPGEPLNTAKILKDLTGFTEYEQKYLLRIKKKDWIQEEIYRLRNKLMSEDVEKQIWDNFALVQEAHASGETTTNDAIKSLNKMLKEIEDFLDEEKRKKDKLPKLKKDRIPKDKASKKEVPAKTLLLKVNAGATFSETPHKFSEQQSTLDFCFKADKYSFGVAKTMNSIVGFAVRVGDENYLIKPEMLAKFIEKELK